MFFSQVETFIVCLTDPSSFMQHVESMQSSDQKKERSLFRSSESLSFSRGWDQHSPELLDRKLLGQDTKADWLASIWKMPFPCKI